MNGHPDLFDRQVQPSPEHFWDHRVQMWRAPAQLIADRPPKYKPVRETCNGCGAHLTTNVCSYCKRTAL